MRDGNLPILNAMDRKLSGLAQASVPAGIWLFLALISSASFAIDNPDAPDYVSAFESRAKPLEDALAYQTSISEVARASVAYSDFLDAELNKAYQALMKQLDAKARAKMKVSQRAWLSYFKAETEFISENWTPANFGSSYILSRAQYRLSALKERTKVLLSYLQNYSSENPVGASTNAPATRGSN